MNKLLSMLLAVLALSLASHISVRGDETKPKDIDKLVGAWELAGVRQEGQKDYTRVDKSHVRIKLITTTYYTLVQYDPATGQAELTAGGQCYFNNGKWIEHIEFAAGPAGLTDMVGKYQTFEGALDGDGWHQKGTTSNGLTFDELWVRVKEKTPFQSQGK